MVVNSRFNCFTRDVTIEVPAGQLMANVRQEYGWFSSSFHITDTANRLMFKVSLNY